MWRAVTKTNDKYSGGRKVLTESKQLGYTILSWGLNAPLDIRIAIVIKKGEVGLKGHQFIWVRKRHTRKKNSVSFHEREFGFRNQRNFCFWNLEFWALESGMQLKESGIPVTIGIRNPSSKDKNLEPSDWNPESKIVSDSLTCGDLSVLPTTLASNKNIYRIKMWMCLAQNTNWHSIWFTRFAEQRSTFTFSLCLDRKWGSRRESKSQPLSCTKGLWSQSIKEKKDIADLQTSHVPTPFIHYHYPY